MREQHQPDGEQRDGPQLPAELRPLGVERRRVQQRRAGTGGTRAAGRARTAGPTAGGSSSSPPTTSRIGYGIRSHRASTPRPTATASRPSTSSTGCNREHGPRTRARRDYLRVAGMTVPLAGRHASPRSTSATRPPPDRPDAPSTSSPPVLLLVRRDRPAPTSSSSSPAADGPDGVDGHRGQAGAAVRRGLRRRRDDPDRRDGEGRAAPGDRTRRASSSPSPAPARRGDAGRRRPGAEGARSTACTAWPSARTASVYLADTWNNRVRKYDPKAEHRRRRSPAPARRGSRATAGRRRRRSSAGCFCVALRPGGEDDLYVTDLDNRRIRKVDMATGIVTTVAGNGQKGVPKDGEAATTQPLVDPRAVRRGRDGERVHPRARRARPAGGGRDGQDPHRGRHGQGGHRAAAEAARRPR